MSVSMLHSTPRVISIGSTQEFKSKSKIDEVLSVVGMVLRTFLLLHSHLVNRNPPLDNRTHKSALNLLATSFDCTDFKQSST